MKDFGFWIGTYTNPGSHARDIQGEGIVRGSIDRDSGKVQLETVSAETPDPSYLAQRGDRLYAVAERMGKPGELHECKILNGHRLRLTRAGPTAGKNACFVTTHGSGALVANYMDNRLAFLTGDGEGWSRQPGDPYLGSGPHPVRQTKPHPHHCLWLPPSGHVGVCDLGSDRVWLHAATEDAVEPAIAAHIEIPPAQALATWRHWATTFTSSEN